MPLMNKGGLGGVGAVGGDESYIIQYEFPNAASGPLSTPDNSELGRANYVQVDGNLSKASGRLVIPPQTTPAWGDEGVYFERPGGGAVARTAGRVFRFSFSANNYGANIPFLFSWHNAAALGSGSDGNSDAQFLFESGNFRIFDGVVHTVLPTNINTYPANSFEQHAIMLLATGALYFRRVAGNNRLVWVGVYKSTANVYPAVKNYFGDVQVEYVHALDKAIPTATLDQPTPVSNTVYVGDANGTIDATITAPGVLANQTEIRFRRTGPNDYLALILDSAGALNLVKVVSGTPTTLSTTASVIAGGQTRRVRVMAVDNKLNPYSGDTSQWTKRGAEITETANQTATDVQAVIGAGWAVSNLQSWALDSGKYSGVM